MIKRESKNGIKALLLAAWNSDRRAFAHILLLNIISSMLNGIGIVMLIPLLNLINIGTSQTSDRLSRLFSPMADWPYGGQVAAVLAVYVLLVTMKALLGRRVGLCETAFMEDTAYRLRNELYQAVSGAEWEQLAAQKQTDLINLFTSQASRVCSGYGSLIGLFSSLVSAAVQLGIALLINLPLSVLVCLLGAVMMAVFKPLRRKSEDFGNEALQISQDFNSELANQISSIRETRAYGVERAQAEHFHKTINAFRDMRMRYSRLFSIPQVVYSVAAALLIAAVYLIAVLFLRVEVDRLVVMVYIFARLWPLFSGLQGDLEYIHGCLPAYEKLTEAVQAMQNAKEQKDEEAADFSGWNEIRFQNVAFTYRGGNAPVLRDVSFSLRRGSVTALLGHNGAGKTTVANLLLGLLKPESGQISIDETPLTERNLRAWRRQAGYVPQDPILLNASVRENLTRFHPAVSEKEMTDALKRAQAWDIVQALPQGMETMLGERGVRLSGGERQRLVLARVLIGKPRLVVLDEATSAMDYESELAFQQMIRSMEADTAVLLIAHRLSTIRMASRALVLENGEITQQGDIEGLLNQPDGYLSGMVSVD